MSVVRKEMLLLKSSLPAGILIRGFEDAMVSFGFFFRVMRLSVKKGWGNFN